MTKPDPKKPGPDSTLADVRMQILDAALTLLAARGVDISFEDISLGQAIEAAGVTRSTAYRSLADESLSPQAVLHRELQRIVMQRHRQPQSMQEVQTAIAEVLQCHGAALEHGDVAARTYVMRSIIRIGGNVSYANVAESTERAILTSLYGALRSSDECDWRAAVATDGELLLNEMFTNLYKGLAELFHYQPKPGFCFEQMAAAGSGLIEGIAMRHNLNPHAGVTHLPTGQAGEAEEWSLFSITFEKLVIGMLEPKDQLNPYADLLRY